MATENEIDLLITKFLSGEALPEEAMELAEWINISPENKLYFTRYSRLFALNDEISFHDKNRAWENINHLILRGRVINWRWVGIAASVLIVFTIGLLISHEGKKESGAIVYTADTATRNILLPDNSLVLISPGSSISIDKKYGASNRKIKLNGSAVFSVIHNASKALIIDLNPLHIKDIGTKFSVVSSPVSDSILITVDEGAIAVYDDFGSRENARAREHVLYIKSQKKIEVFHINHDASDTTPGPANQNARTQKIDSLKTIRGIAPADTTRKAEAEKRRAEQQKRAEEQKRRMQEQRTRESRPATQ